MATIVSRQDTSEARVQALQDSLIRASKGAIGRDGVGLIEVGNDLDALIFQTDEVLRGYEMTLERAALTAGIMEVQLHALATELDVTQDMLASIVGDIDYDEALDHAAADLMDCFCASGAADVSADGELIFDERISFTKEDIKPMLREAIVRWIELKMTE